MLLSKVLWHLVNFFYRIQLGQRKGAKRTMAKGIFLEAEVVRGHDWLWADQDGKGARV